MKKTTMRKVLAMLLALAMAFAMCACVKEETPETETTAATETAAPETEAQETDAPAPVAQEVQGVTVPEFAVTVNGVTVDQNLMAEYPLYSVQATSTNSSGTTSTVTYVGFSMKDVCAAAGLTEEYVWMEATADDGYAVTITADVMADTTLLAMTKDGEQFGSTPWMAPCTSQTTGDYLKGCVSILVNTTEGAPEIEAPATEGSEGGEEGDSEELTAGVPDKQDKTDKVEFADFTFKVNGTEVTNATLEGLSIYKVSVATESKSGELQEATYTGYVLSDVLTACGVTDYTTVKAIAEDGYECELTAEQAASEYTIVAIEKDKELGENGTIWVAPCTETSSKSYCKLVVEITAE